MGSGRIAIPCLFSHRISKALSLNHTKLKHYVQDISPNPSMPMASFIEPGLPKPTLPFRGIIEMQHQDGARMTMQITDQVPNYRHIIQAFMSAQRFNAGVISAVLILSDVLHCSRFFHLKIFFLLPDLFCENFFSILMIL